MKSNFICMAATVLLLLALLLNEYMGSNIIIAAMAVWVVVLAGHVNRLVQTLSRTGLLVWLIPAFAMASTLWSQEPMITFRIAGWCILTTAFAVILVDNVSPRQFIYGLWIATIPVLIACVIYNKPYFDGMTGIVSYGGIFGNKNTVGTDAAFLLLSGLSMLLGRRVGLLLRLLAIGSVAGGIVMLILSRSIGVTLTAFAAAGMLLMVAFGQSVSVRSKKQFFDILAALAVVIGTVALIAVTQFGRAILGLLNKDETLTGRTWLWDRAAQLIPQHPWFGVGYQAFWIPGHSEPETIWRMFHVAGGFHFHNIFYELAIELGIVGAVLAAFVLLVVYLRTMAAARVDPTAESGFFLAFASFVIVMELNAVNLFMPFNVEYLILVAGYLYALRAVRSVSPAKQAEHARAGALRPAHLRRA